MAENNILLSTAMTKVANRGSLNRVMNKKWEIPCMLLLATILRTEFQSNNSLINLDLNFRSIKLKNTLRLGHQEKVYKNIVFGVKSDIPVEKRVKFHNYTK